jgi:hypothetical protein
MLDKAINQSGALLAIHAGAVASATGTLLLPGDSGVGKSSLTLALSEEGLGYLSDEIALLDDEMVVTPLPVSFCVKQSAWELAASMRPDAVTLPQHHRKFDGKWVRYVPPRAGALELRSPFSRRVRWVVFPAYRPDASTHIEELPPDEGMRRLLQLSLRQPGLLSEDRLRRLLRSGSEVRFGALLHATLPSAVAALRRFAANASDASVGSG